MKSQFPRSHKTPLIIPKVPFLKRQAICNLTCFLNKDYDYLAHV